MYYNKTGEAIKDQDMINADTIIDYETIPLSQVPMLFQTPASEASSITKKTIGNNSMQPPEPRNAPSIPQGMQGSRQ